MLNPARMSRARATRGAAPLFLAPILRPQRVRTRRAVPL